MVIGLLWPTMRANADNMGKICHKVLASIRLGDADHTGDPVLYALQARGVLHLKLDDNASDDAIGTLEKAQWTPQLRHDVTTQFDVASGRPLNISWLGHSGAGAIEQTAGTAYCTNFLFFDTHHGPAHEIAFPNGVLGGEADYCELGATEQDNASIGTIDSVPAFLSEQDTQAPDLVKISIVPWLGDRWGDTCQIGAAFVPMITVTEASCRDSGNCPALQAKAKALAQVLARSAKSVQDVNHSAMPPSGDLAKLIPKTPNIGEFPKFQGGEAVWYKLLHTRFFGLRVGDRPALAVVRSGDFYSYDSPAYVMVIWGKSGDKLVPWASFVLEHGRGKVLSATIEN